MVTNDRTATRAELMKLIREDGTIDILSIARNARDHRDSLRGQVDALITDGFAAETMADAMREVSDRGKFTDLETVTYHRAAMEYDAAIICEHSHNEWSPAAEWLLETKRDGLLAIYLEEDERGNVSLTYLRRDQDEDSFEIYRDQIENPEREWSISLEHGDHYEAHRYHVTATSPIEALQTWAQAQGSAVSLDRSDDLECWNDDGDTGLSVYVRGLHCSDPQCSDDMRVIAFPSYC